MAESSLNWTGAAVTERLRAAQIAAVNFTMGACVNDSKTTHTWQNRSGILEGGIGLVEDAAPEGQGVKGVWGVSDVKYALIHELGGTIVPVRAKALAIPQSDGTVRFVKSVTIPARPYLRPSADRNYPSLADNIRRAYQKSGPAAGGDGDAR